MLPTLGVVFPWAFEIGVPRVVLGRFHGSQVRLEVRILLEVSHVLSGMATLQKRIRRRALLFALPQEVFSQRLGEFGGQHVPPRCARRVGRGVGVARGADDGHGPAGMWTAHS